MKLLATLFLFLALALPTVAQNSRATIHAAMHETLIVAYEDAGYCTAYAVGPRTIAIAEHCLGEGKSEPETLLFVFEPTGKLKTDVTGVMATNEEVILDGNDHALVVLKDIGFNQFHEFDTWIHDAYPAYTPVQGERVIMWGAPMAIACRDCYREGYFSGWARTQGYELMWFALSGTPGDSGSLIFNESGRLVGEVSVGLPGFTGCLGFTFTAEDLKHIK